MNNKKVVNTPTPWKFRTGTVYEGSKAGFRFETTVANCQGSTQEEMEANAALIVLAVNMHHGLIMELKFLLDAIVNGSHADMEIAVKNARQAISKVESV